MLFALNDFTNCQGNAKGGLPSPVSGLSFVIEPGAGRHVLSAVDALTGERLPLTTRGPTSASIALPAVDFVAAVEVQLGTGV